MSALRKRTLAVLLLSLVGCGGQLVEFADEAPPPPPPPPDATIPTIVSTDPAANATAVFVNKKVSATFSEPMDSTTLNPTTFTLKQGTTAVTGVVSYIGTSAIFSPTGNFAASTTYTATVSTGAKDVAGTAMAALKTWSFTTGVIADNTPPTVTSTSPANLATAVPVEKRVTATFSEPMDPTTVIAATFTLKQGTTTISGTVSYAALGTTATFDAASDLGLNLVYTATLSTGAKDSAGNALTSAFTWSFTTGGAAVIAPTVVSTDPADNATAVVVNKKVSATFSEAMDPATINTTTFTLRHGTTSDAGTVSYIGTTATIAPASDLLASTVYTATISTGAKDLAGNAMAALKTWSFTTGTIADTGAPNVASTSPVNLATNVPIRKQVTATFSEPMDPTTVNAFTFTLKQGTTVIPGTVSYAALGTTGTFIPASDLGFNLVYTATITTGAKDSAGNPLASDFTWTFTTSACGQAPVALGAAASFAVLAGSTVTNTGETRLTGDLGVSPGSDVTGFPPGTLTGAIQSANGASAAGMGDLTTAYNDAAGRTLCPVSVAGNLGGQTLAPGLYKSTGSLEISSADLTLDAQGDADAVFIFQIASTLTTTPGRQVILSGGAKAANVFWQVGSSATLDTISVFKGTIMADQAITLNTGATLEGRALARIAAVALDSNSVTVPAP